MFQVVGFAASTGAPGHGSVFEGAAPALRIQVNIAAMGCLGGPAEKGGDQTVLLDWLGACEVHVASCLL